MISDGPTIYYIIVTFLIVKAFYTACEVSITEISEAKVKSYEFGNKRERRLYNLLKHPAKLLTTFSFSRIFSVAIISYLAVITALPPLSKFSTDFFMLGDSKFVSLIQNFVIAIVTVLVAVIVMTVFCDGIPRRIISAKNSEKFALFSVGFVQTLVIILTPVTAISNLFISLFSGAFGIKAENQSDIVTEEEILMMVDAGNETGVIEQSQKDMINNVIEFNDLTASDIMTHRTDIVAVSESDNIYDVVSASINSGFSRIPVYRDSIDHIIGIICVKDLLCMVGTDSSEKIGITDFIREVIYLPESVSCSIIFKKLTEEKMQIVIIVDEYGGTAGIVSMEDVVETIVGNIQDEYDDEADDIIEISEDTYIINGTAEPEDVLRQIGINLSDDNDFDTISGFIVDLLGRIPDENENPSLVYKNVMFTILVTKEMCITKIKAKILSNEDKNNMQIKENIENES